MKKITGLLIVFLGIGSCVLAQQREMDRISVVNFGEKGSRQANYMKDSLGLSTAQTTGVDSVMTSYLRSIAVLEGQSITPAQRAQAIATAAAKRDTDLQSILTSQQYNTYKSMLQANETRIRARLQTN